MTQELAVYDIFQGTQVRKVDRGDGKVWRFFTDCHKSLGFKGATTNQLKRIPKQYVDLIELLAKDGKYYKQWVIDEVGLTYLIAYSRLPKEQLDAFREVIGQRAAAPQITHTDEIVKLAVREAVKELSAITGMSFFNLDTRISKIEYDLKPKKKQLTAGESDREVVNKLMQGIIKKERLTGFDVGKRWNGFYRELGDAHGLDLISTAKASKLKPLDIVDKQGLMSELIGMIKGK